MILQALHDLAEREGLTAAPHYEPRPVAWLVRVSPRGKLLGIEGTHTLPESESGRRRRPRPKKFDVPRRSGRTSGDKAEFGCDKAEYVFGIDPAGERSEERLKKRFGLFRELWKACADATGDEGAEAVARLLEDIAAGRQSVELPEDCAGNDLFAFILSADVDRLVTDREVVREYWRKLRSAPVEDLPMDRRCLVSGERVAAIENFPQIKKVPGKGTTSGVALVSFNQKAFESYGWRGNDNAPISRASAEACATALNRLLDPAYPDPEQPGQSLPRRNIRLSADTTVCYWAARDSGDELCGVIAHLLEGNPEQVGNLYRSLWQGKAVDIADPSAFYALTITGQQGRAIVRDWFESTVEDVACNLARHFRDLAIVRRARRRDAPADVPIPMAALLEAIAQPAERRSEGVPAHLAAQFVRAALAGAPYPLAVLQRALPRYRAEIGNEAQEDGRKAWQARNWNDARAALVKAVLNRRTRAGISQLQKEVTVSMDPGNRNEGYLLGQLMAVFERLQQIAVGDPNASVVDRFFSGASASPKSVFVRLYRNSRHHARKARDGDSVGMAFRLERLIDELSSGFGLEARTPHPHHNALPAFLDLEQQGLFVLGYHHMRHWLWMNAEERRSWEADHPDAPRAYLWGKQEAAETEPNAL